MMIFKVSCLVRLKSHGKDDDYDGGGDDIDDDDGGDGDEVPLLGHLGLQCCIHAGRRSQ